MRHLLSLLFCFLSFSSFSQTPAEISDSLDIPDQGWNKALIMRNGNTLLFHFEMRKHMTIKVFDKARKEIASTNLLPKILDLNLLESTIIRAVYDINGEAVLFLEQMVDNKNSLIRMRFDATNGKMTEEKVVQQSTGLDNATYYRILKQKGVDTYAVLCFRPNIKLHPNNKNDLVEYNEKHEEIRSNPITANTKDFRYIFYLGSNVDETGAICILFYLSNEEVTSTRWMTVTDNSPTIYNKYLAICYKPKNNDAIASKMIQIPNDVFPEYALCSYNPFAKNINILVLDSRPSLQQFGVQVNYLIDHIPLFITVNTADLETKHSWLMYTKVDGELKQVDTSKHFTGIPFRMSTDENGLTTVMCEGYSRYTKQENNGYNYQHTCLGNIALTQLDDDGNELWGGVIPKAAVLDDFLYPSEIVARGKAKALFRKSTTYALEGRQNVLHKQRYDDQFASLNAYQKGKNFYFVYNDNAGNFNTTIAQPGDSVYQFEKTDAFYSVMNKKREIKKSYLFGQSGENESRSAFLDSADFDEKTGTYATLLFHRKGDTYSIHMAWCHLE